MTKKKNTVTLSLGELHEWIDASHPLPSFNPDTGLPSSSYGPTGQSQFQSSGQSNYSSANVDLSRVPRDGPYVAFVGGLPKNIDDRYLAEFFEVQIQCRITECNISLDQLSGRSRGFALITFSDRESLIQALSMNGVSLKNNTLRIDLPNSSQGGGRDRERRSFAGDDSSCWRNSDTANSSRSSFGNNDQSARFGGGYSRPKHSSILDAPGSMPMAQRPSFSSIVLEQPAPAPSAAKSNPFGDARPVAINNTPQPVVMESEPAPTTRRPNADPFGGARPVDVKPEEVIAKLNAELSVPEINNADAQGSGSSKKSPVNPFGDAKPVDIKAPEPLSAETTPSDAIPKPVRKSDPFAGAKAVDVFNNPEDIRKRAASIKGAKGRNESTDSASPQNAESGHIEERTRRISTASNEPPGLSARPSGPRVNPFGDATPKDTAKVYEETELQLMNEAAAKRAEAKAEAQAAASVTPTEEASQPAQVAAPVRVLRRDSTTRDARLDPGASLPIHDMSSADSEKQEPVRKVVIEQPESAPRRPRIDPFGGAKPTDTQKAFRMAEELSLKQAATVLTAKEVAATKPVKTIMNTVPFAQLFRGSDATSGEANALPSIMIDSAQAEMNKVAELSTPRVAGNTDDAALAKRNPRNKKRREGNQQKSAAGDENTGNASAPNNSQQRARSAFNSIRGNRERGGEERSERPQRQGGDQPNTRGNFNNADGNERRYRSANKGDRHGGSGKQDSGVSASNDVINTKSQENAEPLTDSQGFTKVNARKSKRTGTKN